MPEDTFEAATRGLADARSSPLRLLRRDRNGRLLHCARSRSLGIRPRFWEGLNFLNSAVFSFLELPCGVFLFMPSLRGLPLARRLARFPLERIPIVDCFCQLLPSERQKGSVRILGRRSAREIAYKPPERDRNHVCGLWQRLGGMFGHPRVVMSSEQRDLFVKTANMKKGPFWPLGWITFDAGCLLQVAPALPFLRRSPDAAP